MRSARDNTHTKIAAAAGAGAGGGALNKQKRKRRSKYFKRECGTWPMATGCVARAQSNVPSLYQSGGQRSDDDSVRRDVCRGR